MNDRAISTKIRLMITEMIRRRERLVWEKMRCRNWGGPMTDCTYAGAGSCTFEACPKMRGEG